MFSESDLLYLLPEGDFVAQAVGNFSRQVLLVVAAEPEHPQNLEFLKKVLAAAGLDIERDCLLLELPPDRYRDEAISLNQFWKTRCPETVLAFGIRPEQLGLRLQIHPYQITQFYQTQFLFADKLSLLEPDRERKGKLWNSLKIMFLG